MKSENKSAISPTTMWSMSVKLWVLLTLAAFLNSVVACSFFQEPVDDKMLQEIFVDRNAPQYAARAFTWAIFVQDEIAYDLVTEEANSRIDDWFAEHDAATCEYLGPDDGSEAFLAADRITWFVSCSSSEGGYYLHVSDFEFWRAEDGSYLISDWRVLRSTLPRSSE